MSTEGKRTYINGLSGIRAIAILMVVFYHLKFSFARGGLLGVTVFFVISGFLVTRNLLREAEENGKISFSVFWAKRLKRLLPAVIFMIAVTVILNALFNRILFSKECRDILSVLTGTNNWHQIFSNVSYFENAGAPSPLTHCWSLSIKVQFYLLISVLFLPLAGMKNRKEILSVIFTALSLISMTLMFLLFDPSKDPSRVYYGTDTRIFSLLAGSLIALYEPQLKKTAASEVIVNVSGFASLAGLLAMMIFISGYSSFMFRGGQILATLLSALLIIALLNQKSVFAKAVGFRALESAGSYSYGLYLWHYPLILLICSTENSGPAAIIAALGASILMTVISALFVEMPVSSGMVSRSVRILNSRPKGPKGRERQKKVRMFFLPAAAVESALVITAVLCIAFVPKVNAAGNIEELERQAEEAAKMTEDKIKERQEAALATEEAEPSESQETDTPPEQTPAMQARTDDEICGEIDLLLIGDSVSLGASEAFYSVFPYSICDAAVSRYTTESFTIYDQWRYIHGWDGDGVIFALGANGMLYDSLPTLRTMIGEERPFFLMSARAPHTEWAEINNEEIRTFVAEHDHTYLIDWYAYSEGHPEYFIDDDTHLTPAGADAYAQCIKEAILEVYRES